MKHSFAFLITGLVLISSVVFAQQPAQQQTGTEQEKIRIFDDLLIPREYSKEDVQPLVLQPENWDQWSVLMPIDQGLALKKQITAKAKIDDSPDSKYCLGIKCVSFVRGFNWVELKPPSPIRMPENTKAISALIMGRNFRHKICAWVRDDWGQEYRIEMGTLNYKGWKRVATIIPSHVKTYSRYVPEYRSLWLTKFVIEFDPEEYPGEEYAFYLYIDRFEVARDVYKDTSYEDLLLDEYGQEQFDREQWSGARENGATGTTTTPAATPAK